MTHFNAGEQVDPAIYFNLRRMAFESMEEEGALPGGDGDVFYRVPAIAMLVVGPMLGLAYFLFLPFIGFALVGSLLAREARTVVAGAAGAAARSLRPAWQPTRAFLTTGRQPAEGNEEPDRWAEDAERDLESDGDHERQSGSRP